MNEPSEVQTGRPRMALIHLSISVSYLSPVLSCRQEVEMETILSNHTMSCSELARVSFLRRFQRGGLGIKIHLTVSLKKELLFLFDLLRST